MLRSMYSGISGMKVNQTKLDVIGNNISNVGTTAYKSSRTKFQDMLYQNVGDAMAPTASQGGTNAKQVGLGVQLASIDQVMTQGMMQSTGRSLDIALDGDGFFMVSKGPEVNGNGIEVNHRPGSHGVVSSGDSEILYTRDGGLILDESGNLLTVDGFRVLGYPLTNDDNALEATSQNPNMISLAGFDIRFGPGSQLNGYKVVLGKVGPETVTEAKVNKADKTIVLNGDFSSNGSLGNEQVSSAINKALSEAGISQKVEVSGKPVNIGELGSDKVFGGADATSPGRVSLMGFTFQFNEGSNLNGYTIEVGEIGTGTKMEAIVNPDTKKIVINADFITKGVVTSEGLKDLINGALAKEGINQSVTAVTGTASSIGQVFGETDKSGTDAAKPKVDTVAGLALNFKEGSALNGFSIKFDKVEAGQEEKAVINRDSKTITLSFDPDALDTTVLTTKINDELKAKGITTIELEDITGTLDKGADFKTIDGKISDGSDLKAPKPINIAGLTMTLPKGSAYNEASIEIADVKYDGGLDVKYTGGKFVIKGDFTTPGAVTAEDLAKAINDELGLSTSDNKVIVTGVSKVFTGLSSNSIEGGSELKTPGGLEFSTLKFDFTAGAALNGYKIEVGNIAAGTKASADIDTNNKKIIINGDFVTAGAITRDQIQNAINTALQEKGISQPVRVTGAPPSFSGVESDETNGGTSVQSMSTDGSIYFVDGTKDVKAYDENLKTIKIPDKIKMPGSDVELSVKTFTIDKSGIVTAVLEDGSVAAIAQLAIGTFKNPEGLVHLGKNLYSQSTNSGEVIVKSGVGTLGEDNSRGFADTIQGMLEMSNVDLSEQFTDMIVTNRAFQAAGKMITTGDEILQEIINLKR